MDGMQDLTTLKKVTQKHFAVTGRREKQPSSVEDGLVGWPNDALSYDLGIKVYGLYTFYNNACYC